MKTLSFIIACLSCTGIYAQKEKPVFVEFLSDNELLVVYKAGLNTVFNVPDMSVKREFSLKEPKLNTGFANLSPAKDRLITFDRKLNKRVVWDVNAGTEILSIESSYNAPAVFLPDGSYAIRTSSFKVYNLSSGTLIGDLDKMNMPYGGLSVSPSGIYLVNHNVSTLDEGRFVVYDYKKSEKVQQGSLGVDAEITSVIFNATEDSLKLVWRPHMAPELFYTDFPLAAAEFKPKDVGMQKYKAPTEDIYPVIYGFMVGKDILIPLKDFSFDRGVRAVSPGSKWAVLGNNKGTTLVIYDLSTTEQMDQDGKQYRKPREAGRFTSPD